MRQGDFLFGFDVTRVRPCEELNATAYELRHRKTGAELLWLSRPEQNKTFCAAFKTIPTDDTGVFHILEHSVLCGSEKYPVKEPFLDLLKSSMATFLNAMTFPDKTIYPLSSRNEKDFLNLLRVYLDAVFAPSLRTNPNIFRQEGWHFEQRSAQETPIFNGVVFNEMKGALSSVDELIESEMVRLLFPDSCYRFNYGGDPRHIPDLTYEHFLAQYEKFYHPSNARIFLDGDLPVEQVLEILDGEYLSRFAANPPDFDVTLQTPCSGTSRRFYEIAPEEDAAHRAQFTMGAIACTWQEQERQYAFRALCDALAGTNEAPLKKAILKKGLGQDVDLHLSTETAQPWLCLTVQNTDEDRFAEIRSTVAQTLSDLARHGLNRDDLRASLRQLEFRILDADEPRGVELAVQSLNSWLYHGDPLQYLENKACFAALLEKVDSGYFEQLLRESLLDERRVVTLETLPSRDAGETRRQEERARMDAAQKGWTAEEQAAVIRQTLELDAWHQSTDTPEQTAALPQLHLGDLPGEPAKLLESQASRSGGAAVVLHPCDTAGIVHLNLYFPVSDLAAEDYPAASFLAQLLGNLPTARRSAQEIQQALKMHVGKFSCQLTAFHETGAAPEVCKPYFVLQASLLESEADNALPILREILLETDFRDTNLIRDLLLQEEEAGREKLIADGHVIGILRSVSHLTAAGLVLEQAGGASYYAAMGELRRNFQRRKDGFSAWAEQFRQSHFTACNLTLTAVGGFQKSAAEAFAGSLPAGKALLPDVRLTLTRPVPEGVAIPADVSYAIACADLTACGGQFSGVWNVLANILSYDYLWNAVRVQGGAYGTGFRASRDNLCTFYSYRDPSGGKTLEVYRKTADFLRRFCADNPSLDRYIIGAAGTADPLLTAKAQGDLADQAYFTRLTEADRLRTYREMISASAETLTPLCAVLDQAAAQSSVCVVGPAAELSAAGLSVLKVQ
jgi:Zn-dependent M16 (insulinase) family peptidase